MKRTLLTLLLLVAGAAANRLPAQSLNTALFGSVGGGLGAHDNGPFSRRLRSFIPSNLLGDRLVYQTESFSNIGTTLNAELGMLLAGRLMIDVTGERLSFPTVRSVNGPGSAQDEYMLTGMGGGLDLGWAVVNEEGTLVAPFAHVGYYGYSLEYLNRQSVPIPFFEGDPVPVGESATYTGSAPRVALGVQLVRRLTGGDADAGGLALTARLTYGSMIGRPLWEQDGAEVNNGGHTPAWRSVELSIGIGGMLGWR